MGGEEGGESEQAAHTSTHTHTHTHTQTERERERGMGRERKSKSESERGVMSITVDGPALGLEGRAPCCLKRRELLKENFRCASPYERGNREDTHTPGGETTVQGYLAHKNTPPPFRHRALGIGLL